MITMWLWAMSLWLRQCPSGHLLTAPHSWLVMLSQGKVDRRRRQNQMLHLDLDHDCWPCQLPRRVREVMANKCLSWIWICVDVTGQLSVEWSLNAVTYHFSAHQVGKWQTPGILQYFARFRARGCRWPLAFTKETHQLHWPLTPQLQ